MNPDQLALRAELRALLKGQSKASAFGYQMPRPSTIAKREKAFQILIRRELIKAGRILTTPNSEFD